MFNYDRPIEAMFYTNLTVYPDIPNENVIDKLIGEEYTVIINDNNDLPDDITNIKYVLYEKITETVK